MVLPDYLRALVGLATTSLQVEVPDQGATVGDVLDGLETRYPVLRGTLRTPDGRVRPYLRVFAGTQDVTPARSEAPLPGEVAEGSVPLRVIAAISGGSA